MVDDRISTDFEHKYIIFARERPGRMLNIYFTSEAASMDPLNAVCQFQEE